MMKKITIVSIILIWGCLQAHMRFVPLFVGENRLTVEIADTEEKRVQGLMFRQSIADDSGMLFVFDEVACHSMWMRNTRIHLDIIYLSSDRQVVDLYENVPPCPDSETSCPSYPSRSLAKYVLEIKGKRAQELKIKKGDTLFFDLN